MSAQPTAYMNNGLQNDRMGKLYCDEKCKHKTNKESQFYEHELILSTALENIYHHLYINKHAK